jgi:hypothetical protein
VDQRTKKEERDLLRKFQISFSTRLQSFERTLQNSISGQFLIKQQSVQDKHQREMKQCVGCCNYPPPPPSQSSAPTHPISRGWEIGARNLGKKINPNSIYALLNVN